MKKEKREPYLLLTDVVFTSFRGDVSRPLLCSFCKYSRWTGGPCEDDSYPECDHPLVGPMCSLSIEDMINDALQEGTDCWLFRPAFCREVAVDIVGIWLNGQIPDWDTVPVLTTQS